MRTEHTTRGRRRTRLMTVLAVAVATTAVATGVALPAAAAPTPMRDPATLARVDEAVLRADVAGTAWYVDTTDGRVHVLMDSTVTAGGLARIARSAGVDAAALKVERTAGVFRPLTAAGDAIYGGGYRCSLGFNVVGSDSTTYFLTAGHCGNVASTWYTDSAHTTLIGPTVSSTFPSHDYALVRYDNSALPHPGGFTSAPAAFVGEAVQRTGSTTGTHGGSVTALNVTVRYAGSGTVRGMIQTNVCAEPGDSGGPLFDGAKALGLTSGGSGDCKSGGTTFFQPVPAALAAYGVNVY